MILPQMHFCRFLNSSYRPDRKSPPKHTARNSLRISSHLPTPMPPVDVLRQLYSEAMAPEEIVALSIGTRSDCLPPETLELLSDLNQEKPIWIELGLQSIHAKTLSAMNTHTTVAQFDAAVSKLHALGISVIAHVILGFPGETKEMMKDTVRHVAALPVSGIKLQLLHVLRGTALAEQYQLHPFPLMELDEYSDFVIDCLELLPRTWSFTV